MEIRAYFYLKDGVISAPTPDYHSQTDTHSTTHTSSDLLSMDQDL